MKVILRQSVPRLGSVGEVTDVADGYARNYLIPRELAYVATEGNIKKAEIEAAKVRQEEEKQFEEEKKVASLLEDASVTVSAHAGEEGKLFGSVNAQTIVDALQEQGFSVDKHCIELNSPLKELGVFPVTIRFSHDLATEIKVWVVKD